MRKVSVPVGAGYDILIGAGLLGQAGKLILERFAPSRVAIITDSTVDKLYAHRLLSSLQEAGLFSCKYDISRRRARKTSAYTARFWNFWPATSWIEAA